MKTENYYIYIGTACLVCLMLISIGFAQEIAPKKVSKIVLYSNFIWSINNKNITFRDLEKSKSKILINKDAIELINRKVKINILHRWKGGIYGKLVFENNDSTLIEISRHDAYFREVNSGKQYSFSKDGDRNEWINVINEFLTEIHK